MVFFCGTITALWRIDYCSIREIPAQVMTLCVERVTADYSIVAERCIVSHRGNKFLLSGVGEPRVRGLGNCKGGSEVRHLMHR